MLVTILLIVAVIIAIPIVAFAFFKMIGIILKIIWGIISFCSGILAVAGIVFGILWIIKMLFLK